MVERVVSFALVLACVTVVGLAEEPAVSDPWLAAGFTEDGRTQVRAAIQEVIDDMPTQYAFRDGTLVPQPGRRYRGPGTTFDPGGSLVGDLDGVARMLLLHYNRGRVIGRQLIKPELLAQMYVEQPSAEKYGLGFNLEWMPTDGSAPMVRHGGATGTMAWIDFERKNVGVFFTQTPARQVLPFTTRVFTTFAVTGLGRMRSTEQPGT